VTRILITGGAGFIGSALAVRLAGEGHAVTVLDNLLEQVHGSDPTRSPLLRRLPREVRFLRGDITDRDMLAEALDGQEAVVHFAAETGTGQSMYRIDHYARVNVGGTALLLDLLANAPHRVRRLVVASSRSIYGEGCYRTADGRAVYPGSRAKAAMEAGRFEPEVASEGVLTAAPTDEEAKLHPTSVYGITKQVQEQLVLTVGGALGLEPVALRFQNVYGPGQSLSNPYTGILSIFANRILAGEGLNIFEDGRESRDFVFVDDAVEATCLALFADGAPGHAFNVGTGRAVSVMEVAETLMAALGRRVPAEVSGQFRVGDIRHAFACTRRARERLGFVARVPFEEGAARLAAWAAGEGPQTSGYEESLAEMRRKGLMA
jgi:dTDP-L-rhamnose 4-epimerase